MWQARSARSVACALVVTSLIATIGAQSSRLAFEVVSVRKQAPGTIVASVTVGGDARRNAFDRIATVRWMILYAFNLQELQLIGGPDWIRTDRFEIAARAGRDVSADEMRLMVRSLLEDRFTVRTHLEQREMPIYVMTIARPDGRPGTGLKASDDDCQTMVQRPPDVPTGATRLTGCGTLERLAGTAAGLLGAPVVDKTGLSGPFEYSLYYSPEGTISPRGSPFPAPTSAAADVALPHFTTALREQLGLRLESTRGSIDVLVIDSVEQPTEN